MPDQSPQSAPACVKCGEEAEFELVETFMGLDILGPGDPYCAICAHATGIAPLEEADRG